MRFIKIIPSLITIALLGLSIVIQWLPLQVFGLIIVATLIGLIIKNALE